MTRECEEFYEKKVRKNQMRKKLLLLMLFVVILLCQQALGVTVVYPSDGSDGELLAAKEVRRYIYLRTDQLLTVQGVTSLPGSGDLILVCDEDDPLLTGLSLGDSTGTNGFIIKTINSGGRDILVITGNDSTATLHAAYRYAEHLGVGFDLAELLILQALMKRESHYFQPMVFCPSMISFMGRMFGVRMIISHSFPRLQSWV
jgi:hypothetical protein